MPDEARHDCDRSFELRHCFKIFQVSLGHIGCLSGASQSRRHRHGAIHDDHHHCVDYMTTIM